MEIIPGPTYRLTRFGTEKEVQAAAAAVAAAGAQTPGAAPAGRATAPHVTHSASAPVVSRAASSTVNTLKRIVNPLNPMHLVGMVSGSGSSTASPTQPPPLTTAASLIRPDLPTIVFFIGGVTRAEIAALRWLSKQKKKGTPSCIVANLSCRTRCSHGQSTNQQASASSSSPRRPSLPANSSSARSSRFRRCRSSAASLGLSQRAIYIHASLLYAAAWLLQ